MMYAKLFTSIYQGTLRGDAHGLLVFTNLLAHCDKNGVVDMHPKAIAEEVGLSVEQVRSALDRLEAPDVESRSAEEQGRRIIRLDPHRNWGWVVVNYCKYRAIRSEDDRREQNRAAQERWRNKNKPPSARISQNQPESAHTEAEADTDTEADKNTKRIRAGSAQKRAAVIACPDGVLAETWSDFLTIRKAKRAPMTAAALAGIRQQADLAGWSLEMALRECCARGWQGFKAEWVSGHQPNGKTAQNRQEALEASNRDVGRRFLEKHHAAE